MDGQRQGTRFRLCNVQDISNTFLWKFVQPKWKKQDSEPCKAYKITVETLLNELFLFDDQVANEMKMERYADEISVKISV